MAEVNDNGSIQLFEDQKIRTAWDAEKEEWYFSIVDVVAVLTEQKDSRSAAKYWSVLKVRLKNEGSELTTNCRQLEKAEAMCCWLLPMIVVRQLVTNCQQLK